MKTYWDIIKNRNITRLCHFTKAKNLPFILGEQQDGEKGIVANNLVTSKSFIEKTDPNRFDKHEDYVCTSVQYPNAYYFNKVINKTRNEVFNEWVILCISTQVINETSKFSAVNAATGRGRYIKHGLEAFEGLFEDKVEGKRIFERTLLMPDNMTTDIQAEVLIKGRIDKKHITGIIFPTKDRAKVEELRLALSGVDTEMLKLTYCENLFETSLVNDLRFGSIPKEKKIGRI